MTDVVDLAAVRRQKDWDGKVERGEGWEDETATVTVEQDPDMPNHPIVKTETAELIIEKSLTPEAAREMAWRLLNIANAPRGLALRGRREGADD
ncbi:hypothetical protein [Myxococcus landrumensis]|uniref:Uncharacterized protein n=1 Tax=Myxococcus landrumensis TaxID=2813577 RepID=A0ABX7NCM7_9BACT|nr:hypothetical protein [Myxococcus landrumus]QSQ14063.1 hypothetical protein JY572_38075 [Myxococcus landrumus]